jgi:hypothetical protein
MRLCQCRDPGYRLRSQKQPHYWWKNFRSIAPACRIVRDFELAGGDLGIQALLVAARRVVSTQPFSK